MSDEECIHGLGPVSACTICNGRAQREAEAEQAAKGKVRYMPARYPGYCPGCNLPIHEGQMIAWVSDHPTVHKKCWEE